MNIRTAGGALAAMLTTFCAVPSRAADDAALLKDLNSVIALLGLPCGQVVSVISRNDNDRIATCKDGNRYRVFINAEGRVVAQKQ